MHPGTHLRRAIGAAFITVLSACGGGGGQMPLEPAPTVEIQGQVSDGSPWAGAELRYTCADGIERSVRSGLEGRHGSSLPTAALPCLLQATSTGGDTLWTVVVAAGTVNVSPASDWTVARLLRQTTAGLQAHRALLTGLDRAALAQAQLEVRQALAGSGLAAEGDLLSAPAGPVADALLASQRQLLATLAARGIGSGALRHALALNADPARIAAALAQGRLAEALALPAGAGQTAVPQLASGLVGRLTGPADTVFGVNAEGAWRSTDGGRRWDAIDAVLLQVLRVGDRLWARDMTGLLVSADGGQSWTAASGAPAACDAEADRLWLSPQGRLWFFPQSSCAGVADHYSDDGRVWHSQAWDGGLFRLQSLQALANRQPPLRQIFFRDSAQLSVTSCLLGNCVDSVVLDWPFVHWLAPVQGSDEVVAGTYQTATGRNTALAISADGVSWQPMAYLPFSDLYRLPGGDLLASPGAYAPASPSVNSRVQRSADQGRTWQPTDPALGAVDGWLTLGSDTRLRRSDGALELSVDGGQRWAAVSELAAARDRRLWQRGPDGTLLRLQGGAVQASGDEGRSWQQVASFAEVGVPQGPAWVGDRWTLVVGDRLLTSADGRQWTTGPIGLDGTPWAGFWVEAPIVADDGAWVMAVLRVTTPHQPVQRAVIESRDQGRTWSASQRADALALRCGGMLLRWRVVDGGAGSDWQLRRRTGEVWRPLPLPDGVERSAGLAFACDSALLTLRVGPEISAQRLPYFTTVSGARGQSHWVTPDEGEHWFAVGRPGTDLFRIDRRWWSLGPDTVRLWP